MLFDEPTSVLDPEMTQEVLSIIHELKSNGLGILISTHEIGFAKSVADEIYFIQDGEIIESGGAQIINDPKSPQLKKFLKHTYH